MNNPMTGAEGSAGDSEPFEENYELTIKSGREGVHDTCKWRTVSPMARYDAVHAAAGALLAGADSVSIVREKE